MLLDVCILKINNIYLFGTSKKGRYSVGYTFSTVTELHMSIEQFRENQTIDIAKPKEIEKKSKSFNT